ncbi:MAG: InlB B-repeat-containing protein [Coprococcus phoceensis]
MIKTKKIISLVLILAILFTSGVMIVQEVHAEGTSTGVHDIFVAKDDSKLERFKERVLNRLLYLDKAIDVSDLDIAPNEIQYSVNGMDLTGIYAAREIVRKNPFYSTAATTGFPEFTYKDNGCVATVKYTYHPAWTQDFVAKVIASYDEVMALIKPGDSDFAKILKIHDWIVKNVSYGMSTLYYDFGVGALANRKAVCAGYAQCYQFLLSQVGIDSVYIAANTKKEPHAWNLVKLDGHWFHVDCTWDRGLGVNPNVKHTYFMLSDAEFNADGVHSEDWKKPEKGYPTNNVCTIQNKFYASNTDIATDVQIAANPIVLNHKFDPSSTYSHSDTEHWRTCVAGVEVREPHDGSPCTVCGYTAPSVTSYTVALTNDGNGTASASATSAAAGTEITLTAVPNTGYHFKEWKVISGSMTITNNKFTMPAENVEVKAVFEKDAPTTYSLTTQVNGGNGTISASKTGLTAGSTETITFTPDAGYEIDTVTVNGTATSVSGNTLNVTMNENKTVVVTYKAVEYNITVTDGKATVDAGSEISKAAQGTIVTLTANAAPSGKVFDKWEVVSGGITLADVNSATTTFTMPASAVSVKATYKDAPHTHTYNQETVKPEALKTPADCTNDAVYFKSCSCGAISTTDTFAAMGTALGHAYGSDWKYDSTNHWHECSRCHDKKDEAAHDYGSDNVCDTCGYDKTVPHTHNLTLVAAKAATCTAAGNSAYYTCDGCDKWFADATGSVEITDKTSVKIPATGHTAGTEWKSDDTNHWHECTVAGCGVIIESTKSAHTASDWIIDTPATATTAGTKHKECTVCHRVLETQTIPSMGTELKIIAVDNQIYDKASGSDVTITCNGDFAKFTGIKVDGSVVDSSNYTAVSGSTVLTLKASYLGTLTDGSHTITFVYTDGEANANLTVRTAGSEHIHDYGTEWKSNADNHWHECNCGDKKDEAAHSFKWVVDKEATATKKGSKHEECKTCGYKRPAVEIPATGTTTAPTDTTKPNDTTKPGNTNGSEKSPQTGDNSNIFLWFALLFVSVAGVTGITVYNKKEKEHAE